MMLRDQICIFKAPLLGFIFVTFSFDMNRNLDYTVKILYTLKSNISPIPIIIIICNTRKKQSEK